MQLRNAVMYGVSWVLCLGACGPVPDAGESESIEPGMEEVSALETVSQQSLLGDLGSNMGSPVATFNTCGLSNQWRTTCGVGPSRDGSFVWRVPTTGAYTFSTRNSNFDTVLEIRNYRATSEVMGCNDDSGSHLWSAITLTGLIRGSLLLITVEGFGDGECGTAQLNIAQR